MKKAVFFIGGINGSGKTTLIEKLVGHSDFIIGKQKRALIEVGTRNGLSYEEIPKNYDSLIEQAADYLSEELATSTTQAMFIDCHYAFKLQAALAINIKKQITEDDEPYIQAIDDRLIAYLASKHQLFFVFVSVDTAVANKRVNMRIKNIGDIHSTVGSLKIYQEAEQDFFHKLVDRFSIPSEHVLEIDNSGKLDVAVNKLGGFVRSVLVD